jgi:sulfur-oxidizing protein SoxZ
MATRALVNVPAVLRRGEVFEVRTTLAHPMETGYRRDGDGRMLPRDIVRRMEARLDGELVFAADLHPAIAANPYVAFPLLLQAGGRLQIRWTGDKGFEHTETADAGRDMKRALACCWWHWCCRPAPCRPTSRRSGLDFMTPGHAGAAA